MAEPNLLLDALLRATGLSHSGLASRINATPASRGSRYDHASVARWIRDGAVPRSPVPELICEILSARLGRNLAPEDIGMTPKRSAASSATLAHVMDQAKALWVADSRGRSAGEVRSLSGADAVAPLFEWENPPPDLYVAGGGMRAVGMTDVQRVLAVRTHYEQMYRRVGGEPVRPRLVAHLANQVTPLLDGRYDDSTGRALLRAVGGLVAFAGVCAYDGSPHGQALAQRYFFHALRMAKASGDKAFGAYVVALLTNQALYLGDNRLAIQYAETALRAGRTAISPALQADLHAMQAKAYARSGDRTNCLGEMRQAEIAADRVDPTNEPPETSYVQPGLVAVQNSEALRRVGDLRNAQQYAEEAIRHGSSTHARGMVHRLATLSLALSAQGEVEQSVAVADQAFASASGMESGRIRDRLVTVIDKIAPYRSVPVARDFLERASVAVSVTAT